VLNIRPILFILGLLLTTLALAMSLPALIDALTGHSDWQVFLASAGLTMFIGISLILTMRGSDMSLGIREAFILTIGSWLGVTLFASLPFAFAELNLSFADAFFEAMSGITTTGATVIVNLDQAPPGILLWRALLQWLGGIGIIVTAVALLPMLKVGGMQLFRMESSDTTEKILPRTAQVSTAIGAIYFILTACCALAYWLAGMPGFDAVAHSMTTIATGGFSTSDNSIGVFKKPSIEWIAVIFMIIGSLPFVLYLQAVRGRPMSLFRDSQVRWFLCLALLLVVIVVLIVFTTQNFSTTQSLRISAFNTVSILTGTGYSTASFDSWGPLALTIFFIIMFIGGCAGSTTCGIKIFRIQVLYETAAAQIRRLVQPHGIFIPYYNRSPITDEVAMSVMSFFFFYVLVFIILALGLSALGLDFLTALSGAATAISNVGPGLGPVIGPDGNFTTLPDAAKWLLSAGMLLGRLELFTILVLFAPAFWKA
jgi:trk system potassium uptake protein TrkH|tara:strand:- start:524 stop:1972 length:1449 start_codon:yes stop_codon:yes gene_type:complete